MAVEFLLNGKHMSFDGHPDTPLLWVIREELKLTGTKYGCGIAQCGACTVHLNGEAVRSCQIPVEHLANAEVTTIEGLSATGEHPLQKLFVEMNVPQCGYCQTGMLMAAAALIKQKPKPTDTDIDNHITNICRCGTYPRVRAAIHRVAEVTGA